MELVETLKSVDDLIFDVAQWPREAVRHIAASLFPWRVHGRISAEWIKPREERFEGGLSPTMFWLLAIVLPFFVIIDHSFRAVADRYPGTLDSVVGQPWPLRFFAVAIIMIAWPLSSALLFRKYSADGKRNRDTVRRLFAVHCVVLAPASLCLFAALCATSVFHQAARNANTTLLLIALAASFYAEASVAFSEMEKGWLNKIDAVTGCVGRTLLHAVCILMLGCIPIMVSAGAFD